MPLYRIKGMIPIKDFNDDGLANERGHVTLAVEDEPRYYVCNTIHSAIAKATNQGIFPVTVDCVADIVYVHVEGKLEPKEV